MPPETLPLVRHIETGSGRRLVTNDRHPPPGYEIEFDIGAIQRFSPPGTTRLIRREGQFLMVPRGQPRGECEEQLGNLEETALPLFIGVERAVLADGSQTLVAATDRDLLRRAARELTLLGFVESFPNEPVGLSPYTVPPPLPVLVRWVEPARRRHAYGAVTPPASTDGPGPLAAELGRLRLRAGPTSVPLWLDLNGHVSTDRYAFRTPALELRRLVRWTGAPLNWRNFGHRYGRARSVVRRALDAERLLVSRVRPPRRVPASPGKELLGYLSAEPQMGLIELFAAIHPVLPDQFLTHDPLEASDMGYVDLCSLGYIEAAAPLTGTLGSRSVAVPWASRFGLAARR
jgi:hypothetical protein